jgi:hypothetical protein
MSDMSSDAKSVRLVTFNGRWEKLPVWWTRFEVYAVVQKFDQAIQLSGPDVDAVCAKLEMAGVN